MRRVIVNAGSLALLVGACALTVAATPPAVAAEETVTPPTEQAIIVAAEQPIVVVANEPVPRAAPRSAAAAQEWPMPERPRVQIRKAARLAAAAKKRAAPSLIKMALRADFLSPHHVYRLVGVGFGF